MTKKYKNNKAEQKLKRYFTITKVFLALTPIIGYIYVSLRASMLSITFQEILQTMPSITIIFLIAMVNAYVAYLLHLVQQKLEQGDTSYACINMLLLIAAQMITGNLLFVLMLLWIFYVMVKMYKINIKETIKNSTLKKAFVYGGGSFIVILFSSISLFATLRLM
ncbi:MAG: hypothetical protein ACK5LC_09980 [Coprobacillaceae bacterium]